MMQWRELASWAAQLGGCPSHHGKCRLWHAAMLTPGKAIPAAFRTAGKKKLNTCGALVYAPPAAPPPPRPRPHPTCEEQAAGRVQREAAHVCHVAEQPILLGLAAPAARLLHFGAEGRLPARRGARVRRGPQLSIEALPGAVSGCVAVEVAPQPAHGAGPA